MTDYNMAWGFGIHRSSDKLYNGLTGCCVQVILVV